MAFINPVPRIFPYRRRVSHRPVVCQTTEPNQKYKLGPDEIGVRFINTPSGEEVVAAAKIGDKLLQVGDSVGLHIPRACQSGLCGSCTCDIVDTNAEDGRQTVRACQTGAAIPDDGTELVVDVARMKSFKKRDPMSRFENLDTEYVPRAAPRPMRKGAWIQTQDCPECGSEGDIQCYNCDGEGVDRGYPCALCAGSGMLRCAECQGTGSVQILSPHQFRGLNDNGKGKKPQHGVMLDSLLGEEVPAMRSQRNDLVLRGNANGVTICLIAGLGAATAIVVYSQAKG